MWPYLELLIFVLGFFMAYRAGWKSGWNTAFDVMNKVIAEQKKKEEIKALYGALKPKHKVQPSPLTEEEKQPLDD